MLLTIITAIALVLLFCLIAVGRYAEHLRQTNKEHVAERARLLLFIKNEEARHQRSREALTKIYESEIRGVRDKVVGLSEQIAELHAVSLPNYKPATVPDPDAALARLNEAMADLRPGPHRDSRGRFAAKAS